MHQYLKSVMLMLIGCQAGLLSAQNLQFGLTKLVGSKQDTVPSGKIWKIESFVYSRTLADCPGGSTSINLSDSIVLNGFNTAVRAQRFAGLWHPWRSDTYGPEFFLWEQKTPMWLPSGTTLAAGTGVRYISILEFKETP
jgi:hypothetical protein